MNKVGNVIWWGNIIKSKEIKYSQKYCGDTLRFVTAKWINNIKRLWLYKKLCSLLETTLNPKSTLAVFCNICFIPSNLCKHVTFQTTWLLYFIDILLNIKN